MLKKVLLFSMLLGFLGFVWSMTPASAQDPVKLKPGMFIVKLDNEHVRVLEWTIKPGDKELIHTHPAWVTYFLTSGKLRILGPDGKVLREREFKEGDTFWNKPEKHAIENIGTTVVRAIIVEFKSHPYK